jgi:threonyl-tRNA synthetase
MGTIQVDLSMPKRFDAVYIDQHGNKKTPVMVHRAILGSMERFIGVLIEHYAGNFPLWLSPAQVKILPITDAHKGYAKQIFEKLKENNIRVELDDDNETLGKKIRQGKIEKVPYMLVIGDKEIEEGKVTIESRDKGNEGAVSIDKLIEKLKNEINEKY